MNLRRLSIGAPVAEQERNKIDGYFLETAAYNYALDKQTAIIVGRRGTGKSANLYGLVASLSRDKRNHVCVIMPVGYEIHGLVRVLEENIHRSERGYLVESLWKYLVFSELCLSVVEELEGRQVYASQSEQEKRLLEYVNERQTHLRQPFSVRLDMAVRSLVGVGESHDAKEQRARISEALHEGEIKEMRELLGLVLEKRARVAILIDNLDLPWGPGEHIAHLSDLIWGLLHVVEDIGENLQKTDRWRRRVNASLTLFLRSDIFAHIQQRAAEQDKLPIHRIYWDDELLMKVLDQRLEYGDNTGMSAPQIWKGLFPEEVMGVPLSKFLLRSCLPRPRELIFLVGQAIDSAVNRGHQTVNVDDLVDARAKYSGWIFKSILAEDDPRRGKLEAVLFEFAGAPTKLKASEVHSRIMKAGVNEPDVEFYTDLLCDCNFLAIETASQGFRFARDEDERRTMREVAKRIAAQQGRGEECYEVSGAFHWVLQIV